MSERQETIDRLRALELCGGSHEMLSAIARAVHEPSGGWTIGACEQLRQTLVRLLGETDTTPSGGCITDELRRYASYAVTDGFKKNMLAIADRIDAEHAEACNIAFANGHTEGIVDGCWYYDPDKTECKLSEEHGWVRLPVDADGECIHIGDVVTMELMFGGMSKPLVVDRMELSHGKNGYLWCVALDTDETCWNQPSLLHHHHAPTVEDVLREFAEGLGVPVADSYIATSAAKLRLAGGDAE